MSEIEIFQAEAALPYLLDQVEGSNMMIVTFPGYRTGQVDPALWQRGPSGKLKRHHLLLGSDEHNYWGPAQELRGLRTAVRLIEKLAGELGIAPEHVACVGSSNAASLGALTGLSYGAGVLILGGPPINMGTLLNQWATEERRTGGKPMTSAIHLLGLAQREGGPDPVEWMNGLIPSLAATCPHPCRMRIFVSPTEFVYPGVSELYEQRDSFPNVHIELDLTDAPTHDEVAKEFYNDFLAQALWDELGAIDSSAATA